MQQFNIYDAGKYNKLHTMNEEKKCSPEHVWNGKVPTIDDTALENSACDCKKFILQFTGCRCNGTKRTHYTPNPNHF